VTTTPLYNFFHHATCSTPLQVSTEEHNTKKSGQVMTHLSAFFIFTEPANDNMPFEANSD
jgi:hypothetical protein